MRTDYLLLITVGLLLILSPLVKNLTRSVGFPAPVGYIALGFILSVLNRQWAFIDSTFEDVFAILAQLGVFALLFRVGLHSRLESLIAKLPTASLIWLGDVAVNLLLGFAVAYYVLALPIATSLAISTAFSATSVAVSVSVWDEFKLLRSSRGVLLVDVAELDDLSGVILLAILLSIVPVLASGQSQLLSLVGSAAGTTLLRLALFVAICYLFSHYLEERFTRFSRALGGSKTTPIITILGSSLAIAAFAGLLGFSLAIGALFAGLAYSRDPQVVRSEARFDYFYEFFAPFFFIRIGMEVEPDVFVQSAGMGSLLFAAAVAGKLIGVAVPALVSLEKSDAVALSVSMVPRAEIALLVVYQCNTLSEDLVPASVFGGMVVASVLTCLAAPPVLRTLLIKQSKAG